MGAFPEPPSEVVTHLALETKMRQMKAASNSVSIRNGRRARAANAPIKKSNRSNDFACGESRQELGRVSRPDNLYFRLAVFVHDLIVGRHAEQGWIGFRAVNIPQLCHGFSHARIGMFCHHRYS